MDKINIFHKINEICFRHDPYQVGSVQRDLVNQYFSLAAKIFYLYRRDDVKSFEEFRQSIIELIIYSQGIECELRLREANEIFFNQLYIFLKEIENEKNSR